MFLLEWLKKLFKPKIESNIEDKIIELMKTKRRINKDYNKYIGHLYQGGFSDLHMYALYAKDTILYENKLKEIEDGVTVIHSETKNHKYCPLYFIKEEEDTLIIGIKGTSNWKETLHDLDFFDKSSLEEPLYHHAIMQSALKILFEDKVYSKYFESCIKPIRITGFSLGGGIALYMILALHVLGKTSNLDIHAYVYACPSILPRYYVLDKYITCVVNNDDLVCRLPLFNKFTLPGGSQENIIHLVDSQDHSETKVYTRDWDWFKREILPFDIGLNLEDHILDNYLQKLETLCASKSHI